MPSSMNSERISELCANAAKIVENGKGILAADESTGTIGKRFDAINLENNVENRRAYRELLFSAGKDLGKFIGGVILYEETLYQKSSNEQTFPQALKDLGILVGIKVDMGLAQLPFTDAETTTKGLDGLGERCAEYYKQGARFAKWRCVLKINENCPSELAVEENATVLARYASICQENGLVPIVEPEILMDGSHDLNRAMLVSEHVLATVYKKLHDHHVMLEGTLLKPAMVCAGKDCRTKYSAKDVAKATITVLRRTVPAAVPGITFLSGGQSELEATVHLNEINKAKRNSPWALTFSYGRALQQSVLQTWKGKAANNSSAQNALLQLAKANSCAATGQFSEESLAELSSARSSNFVENYSY